MNLSYNADSSTDTKNLVYFNFYFCGGIKKMGGRDDFFILSFLRSTYFHFFIREGWGSKSFVGVKRVIFFWENCVITDQRSPQPPEVGVPRWPPQTDRQTDKQTDIQ